MPALTLVARIPVKHAIGTSLVVISLNCASGLVAHRAHSIEWKLILPFLAASVVISVLASRLVSRAPSPQIKQVFACFILVVGGLTLAGRLMASAAG